MKNKDVSLISLGVGVVAGAALGYVVSLLVSDPDKRKQKKKLNNKVEEIKGLLQQEDLVDRVGDVFDSTSSAAREKYEELVDDFAVRLSLFKGTLASIDDKKYRQVVADFVDDLQEDGEFSDEQLKKLKRYLRRDYKLIKQSVT